MIKFFKELFGSIKEGINEAKEELAQENQQKQAATNKDKRAIEQIAINERFGTALGAPFRLIVFGDWFTLFKSTDDDDLHPIHLYTFGSYPKLEKHKAELASILKRDFDIVDKQSCVETLASYFDIVSIQKSNTILSNVTSSKVNANMWNTQNQGIKATLCAVLSHIIAAATDAGYLSKQEALAILDNVSVYAKKQYNSWHAYSNDFIIGEANVGLNNSAGRGVLKKYIGYLETKQGSPWNTIPWETTQVNEAEELHDLLQDIVWAFKQKEYTNSADFNTEITAYQKAILKEESHWNANDIAINKPEIAVCYEAWLKGKQDILANEELIDDDNAFNEEYSEDGMFQVELCAKLKATNGSYFTNLDLMYQLQKQVSNKELGDHVFFEGLSVHSNTSPESEMPTFYMYCGS